MSEIKQPCSFTLSRTQITSWAMKCNKQRLGYGRNEGLSQMQIFWTKSQWRRKKKTFDTFWVIIWFRLDIDLKTCYMSMYIWYELKRPLHPFRCWVRSVRLFETLTTLSSQMALQTAQCLTFLGSEHCLLDKDDEHIGISFILTHLVSRLNTKLCATVKLRVATGFNNWMERVKIANLFDNPF